MKNIHLLAYPGSKGWFVKILLSALQQSGCRKLFEPFAGSAVAGLTALCSGAVNELVLIEKDAELSVFWNTVIFDTSFPEKILRLPIKESAESVPVVSAGRTVNITPTDAANREVVLRAISDLSEPALGTLVKSQCQFGGLRLTRKDTCLARLGKPVNGVYQGVASWWKPERFSGMVREIQKRKEQIIFLGNTDAMGMLTAFPEHFVFADPPYLRANHFYKDNNVDARILLQELAERRTPWIATYGDHPAIVSLAEGLGLCLEKRVTKVAQGRSHTNLQELILQPATVKKRNCPLFA